MCLGGSSAPAMQAAAAIPQAAQTPTAAAVRSSVANTGGGPAAGAVGGMDSTFTSGAGGVDPSTLTLGRNALLGQ